MTAPSQRRRATELECFPDLVLITPDRRDLHFVELKRRPNKVEPAQQAWLEAFRLVGERMGGVHSHVWWVPEGLPAVLDFLRNEGRRPWQP